MWYDSILHTKYRLDWLIVSIQENNFLVAHMCISVKSKVNDLCGRNIGLVGKNQHLNDT